MKVPQWRHKNEELGGGVEKKIPKKEIDNPSFLWRNMLIFWGTFFVFSNEDIEKLWRPVFFLLLSWELIVDIDMLVKKNT